MNYDAIQKYIQELQDKITNGLDMKNLELTNEEKALLSQLPDDTRKILTVEMSRYSTNHSIYDIREKMVAKGLAQMLKHIPEMVDMIQKSYTNASKIVGKE